ncbi:MAG: Hpt domain-containing protein, partial [Planctomycetota bacterium]
CLQAGMDDYIAKPIRLDVLRQRLAKLAVDRTTVPQHQPPAIETSENNDPVGEDQGLAPEHEMDLESYFATGFELVGNDRKMYFDLVKLYRREVRSLTRQLQQADREGDKPVLARVTHSIKGASMSVGLQDIVDIAGELESALCQNATATRQQVDTLLERLQRADETIGKLLTHRPDTSD